MSHFTFKELDDVLSYDPATGIFTRKKLGKYASKKYLGQETGYKHSTGCVFLSVNRKKLKAHRVAFLLMTGAWPEKEIDHINGNAADNRWENLREVTRSQNCCNTKLSKKNKTGAKGVFHVRREGRKDVWMANIAMNGVRTFLGHFQTKEEAAAAYQAASRELHGEFARQC